MNRYVYAAAAIAAGAINIAWGDFATDWQPITSFTVSGYFPFRHPFAYVTAIALVIAGLAMLNRRTARAGAMTLAIVYGIFAVFWFPRLYWVPHLFGLRPAMILGALDGLGQQVILVCAAVIIFQSTTSRESNRSDKALQVARLAFGVFVVIFGVVHFTSPFRDVAALVPKWLPPGQMFWARVTGAAFILAGGAILSRRMDVLAARLLAVMLAVFSVLALAPQMWLSPGDQSSWGANAYNLAAIGAAWILADYLAHVPIFGRHRIA